MLYDVINKIKQLDRKTKIAILAGIGLVIVGFITLAVVDNVQKQNIVNEIVETSLAYEEIADDPLNSPLKQVFGDTDDASGLYLGNSDVEVVARDGDWLAVRVISLDMSSYGNQYYAIYTRYEGEYQAVTAGSVIDRGEFADSDIPEEYKVPEGIFDAVDRHAARRSDGRLQAILGNSPNKTYPIIDALPIANDFYKITYSFEDQRDVGSFYLYVDAIYGYNNAAINRLINEGFDPGDYRIVFNYDLIKKFVE
jgi:hypothetical protein